jgi:hypothetical protein
VTFVPATPEYVPTPRARSTAAVASAAASAAASAVSAAAVAASGGLRTPMAARNGGVDGGASVWRSPRRAGEDAVAPTPLRRRLADGSSQPTPAGVVGTPRAAVSLRTSLSPNLTVGASPARRSNQHRLPTGSDGRVYSPSPPRKTRMSTGAGANAAATTGASGGTSSLLTVPTLSPVRAAPAPGPGAVAGSGSGPGRPSLLLSTRVPLGAAAAAKKE